MKSIYNLFAISGILTNSLLMAQAISLNSNDRIEKSCTPVSKTEWYMMNSFEKNIESSSSCFPASSTVQHTFNNGQTYTLNAYSGLYVQWQIPDSWTSALDSGEIRHLVDMTDMLYSHFAELVQGEPAGTGLLTIAVNPDDQGLAGLGCVGCKGIELSNGTLDDFKRDIHVPAPGGWLTHEMGHNFDIYDAYIGGYYADWGHAWTSVVQFYLPYYGRWGDYLGDADDELARWMHRVTVPWDALGSGASWAGCVRNGGGCEASGVTANDAWGGLVLRFARLHGVSAFRQVFDYLRDYVASNPIPPTTPEEKNDLLVTALAAGAQLNISCELDKWHWEFSQSVRSELAVTYPGQDHFCVDADGDGYSPAGGDFNDNNSSIHPGATDALNGIDDDSDGFVDDVHVAEQGDFTDNIFQTSAISSALPLRITGNASHSDVDAIRARMNGSPYLKASLRSYNGLQGEFDLGSILGGSSGSAIFTFTPNSVTNFDVSVPAGWDGLLQIKPDVGSSGSYDIIVERSLPLAHGAIALAASAHPNIVRIDSRINLAPIDGELPTSIRFWANGVGFIRELPTSLGVNLSWISPSGYCGPGISAQLLAGDHPISVPVWSLADSLEHRSGHGSVNRLPIERHPRQTR